MSQVAELSVRRAEPRDVDFLCELVNDPDVQPFLGARAPRKREALLGEIERSAREPYAFGRFVIEVDGERVGSLGFDQVNARSRIARLERLAVHPERRNRGIAEEAARWFQRHLLLELGYHRLELEIYAFNERALRHAERVGFVREGVKRNAYLRHGTWVDGVLYALVWEDLAVGRADLLRAYVAAHNDGVRTGNWEGLGPYFAEAAELVFEGPPVGPFRGRDAIVAAYRAQPPDDTVELLEVGEQDGTVTAGYAWSAEPAARAGELGADVRDGEIVRLVVRV
jgi:RimJ/RimL family protein N-acetyltransferase